MADDKIKVLPVEEVEITPEQEKRIKGFNLKEKEDGKAMVNEPILLEDTGDAKDLEQAKEITRDFLLVKIIKGTALPEEIERYKALK